MPSLRVENESTSEALALEYSWTLRKGAQSEHTKLCRLSGVFWNERRCFLQVMWCRDSSGCWRCVYLLAVCLIAGGVFNSGGEEIRCVGGKKGYIYSSSCDLIHILRFVGSWKQSSSAFNVHNYQAPHEWGNLRRDLGHAVRTVCDAGRCFGISYHFYHSDLVHLGANWVVLKLSRLCNHPTWLPIPSSGQSTCNWWHGIENTSLFTLRCS